MLLNLSEGSDSPSVPSTVAERVHGGNTFTPTYTSAGGQVVQVVQYDKIISKFSESSNPLNKLMLFQKDEEKCYEESNDTWRVHGGNTFLPHTPRRGVRDS